MKILKLSFIFLIPLLFSSCFSPNWVQLGEDITGNKHLNRIGVNYDLNLEGDKIAVCYSESSQYVRVFELKNNKWLQIANDISDASKDSSFGDNIVINEKGDILLVSKSQRSADSIQNGEILFFKNLNNTCWVEFEKLNGQKNNNNLGRSLKMSTSGNIIATAQTSLNQIKKNYIFDEILIFQKEDNLWEQLPETITVDVPNAISDNLNLSSDGKTIVFNYTVYIVDKYYEVTEIYTISNKTLEKIHTFKTEKLSLYDVVNLSLSGNGDYLLLGFPDYSVDEKKRAGKVVVYKIQDKKIQQIGSEITGVNKHDYFGHRININYDGNIISIASSPNANNKKGYVKTYKFKDNKWKQLGSTLEGSNVILNGAGNILAIGNYLQNDEKGAIKIYELK